MESEIFRVKGMTCGHCVSSVSTEIRRIPGVREVTVDLATGMVTVVAEETVDENAVRRAVDEAGYEVAS